MLKGLIGIFWLMITNLYILGLASGIGLWWLISWEMGNPDVFTPWYFVATVAALWVSYFIRKQKYDV